MSAKVIKKSGKVAAKKVAKVRGNHCNVLNLNASRGLTIAHMKMFEPICPKVIKFEINTTTKHGMDHAGLRYALFPLLSLASAVSFAKQRSAMHALCC